MNLTWGLIGHVDMKRGVFEYKGLVASFVIIIGREGEEWNVARECVLIVVENLAEADTGLARRFYEFPGLMESLEGVDKLSGEENREAMSTARTKATRAITVINLKRERVEDIKMERDEALLKHSEALAARVEEPAPVTAPVTTPAIGSCGYGSKLGGSERRPVSQHPDNPRFQQRLP